MYLIKNDSLRVFFLAKWFFFIFLHPMRKKNIKILLIIVVVVFITTPSVYAQLLPPAPQSPQGPPQLPVDGGVLALLVAGLFYGVKKSFKKK